MSDPCFFVPSVGDLPVSPLCRDWEDYVSSVPEARLGVPVSSELIDSVRLSFLKEAFFVPWEVDSPASPLCRDRKVPFSGVEEIVHPSSPVKCLIRRGFFGLRAVSPSPVVLKEASLSSKGKDPILEIGLIRRGFLGSISVSPILLVVLPTIGVVELGLHSPTDAS